VLKLHLFWPRDNGNAGSAGIAENAGNERERSNRAGNGEEVPNAGRARLQCLDTEELRRVQCVPQDFAVLARKTAEPRSVVCHHPRGCACLSSKTADTVPPPQRLGSFSA
jgi:hypothetical protein